MAVVAGLLALAATWGLGEPAAACSCMVPNDLESFDFSDVVFTGVALDDTRAPRGTEQDRAVRFEVDRVYAGQAYGVQEVVSDQTSCAMGGIEAGQRYLMFTFDEEESGLSFDLEEGQLGSHLCAGNRLADDAPIPASFGEGSAPTQSGPPLLEPGRDGTNPVWIGSGVVAVLLAIATLVALVRDRGAEAA